MKDAARYRWLRSNVTYGSDDYCLWFQWNESWGPYCQGRSEQEALDATIDAATEERLLTQNAMVGNTRFGFGVKWSTVIDRAIREYEYQVTLDKNAAPQEIRLSGSDGQVEATVIASSLPPEVAAPENELKVGDKYDDEVAKKIWIGY